MMLESSLVEVVSSLVSYLGENVLKRLRSPRFDVLYREADGKIVAIEVKSRSPGTSQLLRFADVIRRAPEKPDRFYLITPEPPSSSERKWFREAMANTDVESKWMSVSEFAKSVGAKGDAASEDALARARLENLIQTITTMRESIQALDENSRRPPIEESFAEKYQWLRRQFSNKTIAQIYTSLESGQELDRVLQIGDRATEITVVITDIKNFSHLVKASRPDDLNEIMSRYYRQAKDAVFANGGSLDKFIGDATVAIFGYPFAHPESTLNAIRAARYLIELGDELLAELLDRLNESIETGTRVGIATNDLWPLDIASDQLEVSFVGDAMNLAARLEKACDVNGIQLDNRTRTKAREVDPAYLDDLDLKQKKLTTGEAKGQVFPIKVWQSKCLVVGSASSGTQAANV